MAGKDKSITCSRFRGLDSIPYSLCCLYQLIECSSVAHGSCSVLLLCQIAADTGSGFS